ncbi:SBP-like protein [Artemisia annua]|uniref:SBP-like protein n=1 Tax=Artemisia annua TaxID=35608 RepID=A0A2U1NX67_ARTAN|nr:SBP-like protein [Artemisia annua]
METKSNKNFSKENLSMTKKELLNDRGDGEDGVGGGSSKWDVKKKKAGPNGSGSTSVMARCCQAEKCASNLAEAKQYHRRHRVCESHAKAQAVVVAGIHQRFCQQCSRFHELSEFDEAKRSCRRRLAGHNERRRKNSMEYKGTGKELVCVQTEDRGRFQLAIQENSTYLQTR